jgi:hypothetical protein
MGVDMGRLVNFEVEPVVEDARIAKILKAM